MLRDNSSKKTDWPARTFRISPELLDRFDAYVRKTGISKTFVVEKALAQYLDVAEQKE